MLQIMSVFMTEAAWRGLYNERTPKHTLKGAIGITIVKNKQKINNLLSIKRHLKNEKSNYRMLNRLMKNSVLELEPIISKSYPAQNNKYFFGGRWLFCRYNFG
ncbi:hypothetical protein B9Q31_21690 [Enterobacter kobei]|nr:hypothetical protein B9Q24_15525 [Enterobacter kobei]PJD40291.1 hypothetical protein B9Q33_23300 [Enterobacter kobei]PJD46308.1 hypothetical protein B9Q23_21340 [Enterobacter kobei]PJD52930.1 hypothetical protein B9Q27_15205 [Enterobacter kobei]PJD55210.1 hypothetical protein B9Q31_21690 [Enterobacter kobei]